MKKNLTVIEGRKYGQVPWLLIIQAALVIAKYSIAKGMPQYVVWAPSIFILCIILILCVVTLIVLLFTGRIHGKKNNARQDKEKHQ